MVYVPWSNCQPHTTFFYKQNISREATSFIMTVYACAKKLSCDDVKKENLLKKLIFF